MQFDVNLPSATAPPESGRGGKPEGIPRARRKKLTGDTDMLKLGLVSVMCVLLVGCGNKITEYVDAKFPPVTEGQQRAAAIEGGRQALSHIHTASLGVGVSLEDVNDVVLPRDQASGVKSVRLTGAEQLLKIDVAFDRTFEGRDAGANSTLVQLLDALKPRVKGTVTVFAGLTSEVVDLSPVPVLQLKLLPYLTGVKIDKVEAAGQFDVTAAGEAVVSVVNRFRDNLSGEISRAKFTSITVPLLSKTPVDMSQTIKVGSSTATGTVVATAKPVAAPYKLEGVAWLIDEKQVLIMAQLIPAQAADHADPPRQEHTFDSLAVSFETHLADDLGVKDGRGNWVAIRKDVAAQALNSVATQAELCIMPTVATSTQHASNEIKLPNGLGIDCTPTKACDARQCTYSRHEDDTRDCNQCAATAPRVCFGRSFLGPGGCTGGQCIQRWNEPTCEAAKAAQNALYGADANARLVDCQRLATQEKVACEAEKAGTKLLCETKKEALNALARTGKFANLDVDANVQTKELKVCLKDFNVTSKLDHLQFSLDVQGGAEARVNVKFVPLDIVGHLTCVMDWSKEQTFQAGLRESKLAIATDVALTNEPDGFYAKADIKGMAVKAKLSPGPTEFLLKSPELLLKCPVLAAVAPTVLTLTPFVPVLRGQVDYDLPGQSLRVKLAVPEQRIGEKSMQIALSTSDQALVAKGTVKKP